METERDGKTPETAYRVYDCSGEMTKGIADFIERKFGGADGDFFIISESTLERGDERYKILWVKDHEDVGHKVYFQIG